MVCRALKAGGRSARLGYAAWILAGVLLGGSASQAQTPSALIIKPVNDGVVLTGKFSANLRKEYPPPYPKDGSFQIATQDGGPSGTAKASLDFAGDNFRIKLLTEDLPTIPARRDVTFTLSFQSKPGLVFIGRRSFDGPLNPEPRAREASNPGTTYQTEPAEASPQKNVGSQGPQGEQGPPGKTPALPFLEFLPLGVVVEVEAILLLALALLLLLQFLQRKRKVVREALAVSSTAHIAPTYKPAGFYTNDTPASLRGELSERLMKWETAASEMHASIISLGDYVNNLSRLLTEQKNTQARMEQETNEQFRNLLSGLDLARTTEHFSPQTKLRDVASAIASVVNEWLAKGGRNRGLLKKLASQAGLQDTRLAEYTDAGGASSSNGPEYSFEFSSDGSWLWATIPNSSDFWAAPADTNFLTMGDAPAVLNKLFDGMKEAGSKFRFKTIYKPCRMRPVTGSMSRFTLVERGFLHLEGTAAPALVKPIDFQSLAQSSQMSVPSATNGQAGATLGSWIRKVAEQLSQQESNLRDLTEEIHTDPLSQIVSEHRTSIQILNEEVDRLKASSKRDAARLQTVIGDAKRLAGETTTITTMPASLPATEMPAVSPNSRSAESSLPAEPAAPRPASESRVDLASSTQAPAPLAVTSADLLEDSELAPTILDELRRDKSASFPAPWQKAFCVAAVRPETDPEETGLPSDEIYLRRVRAYYEELLRFDPSTRFNIVHFQKAKEPNHHLIELHQTGQSSDPDETFCLTCGKSPACQFAVCAGENNEGLCYLLFPRCMLAKGKYASVYSALIDALPEVPFSTAAMEGPAVLERDQPTGFFIIARKIKLIEAQPTSRT